MNLAFLQKNTDTHNMNNTVSALIAVAGATAFSSSENQNWWQLVHSRQASNDDVSESPALAAAAEVTRGSDRVPDVLSDSVDNAQTQLDDTRVALSGAAHSFALVRQSIENELRQDSRALTEKTLEVFTVRILIEWRTCQLLTLEISIPTRILSPRTLSSSSSSREPRRPCGDATTGACDSESTENSGRPTGPVH